jgi:hypothetical protein
MEGTWRLSDILKDTAGGRSQPTPRLAPIRHKVELSSLQGALVVHIKQTLNSTFKVIKGFPSVGVKLDSDLCSIRGGRSRGVNAFGRLQAYAAVSIEDDNGNPFYLTLDAIGDLRSPWTGWLSLHSSLSKTEFSQTGSGFSETFISRVRFFSGGKKKRVPSCAACSHLSYST